MKRLFIVYTFLLATTSWVPAQNISHIRDLHSALKEAEGWDRVEIYKALAWEHRKSHPDSTLFFAERAIELLRELDIESELAQPLNYMGVAYYYKGDQVRSFDYYNMAMDAAIKHGDSSQYAHSLNSLGRLFLTQGDFVKSYDYYFTALRIFEKINDKAGVSYCYKSLSELYQTQNNYEKALEMSEKAFHIRLESGNIAGQVSMLIELAQIQEHNKNYDKAFDYYLQAKVKAEFIDDEIHISSINLGISHLYFTQEKHAEALIFAHKALDKAGDTKNLNLICNIELLLGKIHFEEQDYSKARTYFSDLLIKSEKSRDLTLQQDAYYYLSEICRRRGQINCAYKNFHKHANLRQTLHDAEAARAIERLESRLEIEKKERENEILKANQARDQAQIDRQRGYTIALGLIAMAVLGLLVMLWLTGKRTKAVNHRLKRWNERVATQRAEITAQNKKINQQNAVLQKQNKALSELNNEKDTLMNIVAHDLKSPFNRIKGISELLTLSGLNDEQRNYISLLQSISQSGVDLIRDLLDVNAFEYDRRKPEISKVDIHDLLLEKVKAFYADAKSKQIELKMEGVESQLLVHLDKIYLSRILDNLISNAIKFSNPGHPVIIKAGRDKSNIYISIKDFGPGFNEEDKLNIYKKFKRLSAQPTAGESSNGLGLAIVKTLIDRLSAKINLKTSIGKGSEFIIKLPPKTLEGVEK